METRIAYITFLECEVRDGWADFETLGDIDASKGGETHYKAWREPAEIFLVRPDGLRRNFSFKKNSDIAVHNGMIKFNQKDLIGEVTIDEDEKMRKSPKTKLDFT